MREYAVTFTQAELQALMGALDAGVRSMGVRAVGPLAPVLAKLEAAAAAGEPETDPAGATG